MKSKPHSSHKPQPRTRLFRFTPREEQRMTRAIEESIKFMRAYGQGRAMYMLDRRHYL